MTVSFLRLLFLVLTPTMGQLPPPNLLNSTHEIDFELGSIISRGSNYVEFSVENVPQLRIKYSVNCTGVPSLDEEFEVHQLALRHNITITTMMISEPLRNFTSTIVGATADAKLNFTMNAETLGYCQEEGAVLRYAIYRSNDAIEQRVNPFSVMTIDIGRRMIEKVALMHASGIALGGYYLNENTFWLINGSSISMDNFFGAKLSSDHAFKSLILFDWAKMSELLTGHKLQLDLEYDPESTTSFDEYVRRMVGRKFESFLIPAADFSNVAGEANFRLGRPRDVRGRFESYFDIDGDPNMFVRYFFSNDQRQDVLKAQLTNVAYEEGIALIGSTISEATKLDTFESFIESGKLGSNITEEEFQQLKQQEYEVRCSLHDFRLGPKMINRIDLSRISRFSKENEKNQRLIHTICAIVAENIIKLHDIGLMIPKIDPSAVWLVQEYDSSSAQIKLTGFENALLLNSETEKYKPDVWLSVLNLFEYMSRKSHMVYDASILETARSVIRDSENHDLLYRDIVLKTLLVFKKSLDTTTITELVVPMLSEDKDAGTAPVSEAVAVGAVPIFSEYTADQAAGGGGLSDPIATTTTIHPVSGIDAWNERPTTSQRR